jgi:hypothetical protein
MIFENEELDSITGLKKEKDIKLITYDDLNKYINAFKNQDNYGIYLSQLISSKPNINKALEDYFGPSVPTRRIPLEKKRGKPFPPKTKQAIDDFIKDFNSNIDILKYNIDNNNLIFPKHQNPEKGLTKKIIKTVMDNAKLNYKLEDVENIEENKTMIIKKKDFRNIIKEELEKYKNPLSQKIDDAIEEIDESLDIKYFAEAVAEVLIEEYGKHNYNKFISTLKNKLNNA